MKKFIACVLLGALVAMSAVLSAAVLQLENPFAYNSARETGSGYPSTCYQNLGYCTGSGAGLSFKCSLNNTGERCTRYYCKEC